MGNNKCNAVNCLKIYISSNYECLVEKDIIMSNVCIKSDITIKNNIVIERHIL